MLIAICITLAATGILLWYLSQPVRYSTAIGQALALTLSDGSRVLLNTNTSIALEHKGNTYRVELQNGEILCDLVDNPSRRLTIDVDGTAITDKGTSFSVRRTENGAIVVVRAGTVRISGAGRPESELTRNQEADVDSDIAVVIKLSPQTARRKLMWQHGRLEFQQDEIAAVVNELNRYTKMQIQIADRDIAHLKVSGSVNLSDPINTFKDLDRRLSWQVEKNADGEPVWMLRKAR